jgi:hypothetical protein
LDFETQHIFVLALTPQAFHIHLRLDGMASFSHMATESQDSGDGDIVLSESIMGCPQYTG